MCVCSLYFFILFFCIFVWFVSSWFVFFYLLVFYKGREKRHKQDCGENLVGGGVIVAEI